MRSFTFKSLLLRNKKNRFYAEVRYDGISSKAFLSEQRLSSHALLCEPVPEKHYYFEVTENKQGCRFIQQLVPCDIFKDENCLSTEPLKLKLKGVNKNFCYASIYSEAEGTDIQSTGSLLLRIPPMYTNHLLWKIVEDIPAYLIFDFDATINIHIDYDEISGRLENIEESQSEPDCLEGDFFPKRKWRRLHDKVEESLRKEIDEKNAGDYDDMVDAHYLAKELECMEESNDYEFDNELKSIKVQFPKSKIKALGFVHMPTHLPGVSGNFNSKTKSFDLCFNDTNDEILFEELYLRGADPEERVFSKDSDSICTLFNLVFIKYHKNITDKCLFKIEICGGSMRVLATTEDIRAVINFQKEYHYSPFRYPDPDNLNPGDDIVGAVSHSVDDGKIVFRLNSAKTKYQLRIRD